MNDHILYTFNSLGFVLGDVLFNAISSSIGIAFKTSFVTLKPSNSLPLTYKDTKSKLVYNQTQPLKRKTNNNNNQSIDTKKYTLEIALGDVISKVTSSSTGNSFKSKFRTIICCPNLAI
jgi:hypothetical protein